MRVNKKKETASVSCQTTTDIINDIVADTYQQIHKPLDRKLYLLKQLPLKVFCFSNTLIHDGQKLLLVLSNPPILPPLGLAENGGIEITAL